MVPKSFKLNNGLEIPSIGFGTWQAAPGQVEAAVETALKAGYRLIDCAYCYGNEAEVGAGLKKAFESGIKREEVFVTGKVWCTYMSRVEENLDMTLKDLGLQYLDLYLVHWPVAYNPNGNHEKFPMLPDNSARDVDWSQTHIDTWHSMERLLETGKVKSIGVCNYSKKYLDQLLPVAKVIPAVNQIENHPLLPQTEVVEECKKHGILVEAYSPCGLGVELGEGWEWETVKKKKKGYMFTNSNLGPRKNTDVRKAETPLLPNTYK
ncbi:putative d-galacturonic acid reductase [Phaeomoniella chlamydospora]|uniref:D-xylose reductase [NAD(P)H] n=1 Tax=Phaeomoniella chlamydospora TaxID=158046 RepID=A0A0G2F4B5_PHACM|nr:putative d-galacturonic acid reductase [Phaeomoniella chlamydospora]